MKIKRNIGRIAFVICLCTTVMMGCKKFLTVEPIDRLTGNNFYQSKEDVEANIARIYSQFFEKLNESWVIGAIGEARSGEIFPAPTAGTDRMILRDLGTNNMNAVYNNTMSGGRSQGYAMYKVSIWDTYYKVIQSCNILISKLEEGIPGLSASDKDRYKAEATFMRCLSYFWMVRLYGDVVYYTDAYFAKQLPREDMVSVISKSIADLESVKDIMPWTFGESSQRGARASRGSIIALLMHMKMWNANFDSSNATKYYESVASLGKELRASGVHHLYKLTPEEWAKVSKGRTEESLFEFYRTINYDDQNNAYAPLWDHFLRWPYKFPRYNQQFSIAYYSSIFMYRIYPLNGPADKRKELWYEDMYANDGLFVLKKFAANVFASGNEDSNPDNTFMIFRYADALLLEAEALANLGAAREAEAITVLNIVRDRAEAPRYAGGGTDLKNFIFEERCRELIGEGARYFDLIRTRRILNPQWTMNPMTIDQYNRRAWTWPLDASAKNFNSKIVLNDYWTGGN
ncbi:RagB/SusD family nutrient uptake outer membrane protein [Sphingobacterium siyangense]